MKPAGAWALCLAGYAAFFGALFGSVVGRGKLLASGDALFESVPACFGPKPLWSDGILLGYPLAADPNQLHWYPPNLLCGLGWYDVLAALPFFIAATGTTGLVLRLTGSWSGAVVAGLGYALGGFMVAHAGHLMISHPAAWAPFVLWALEELRAERARRWLVLAAVSVALCWLGGQPQIPVFTLTLACAYACVSARHAPIGVAPYLRRVVLALGLGLGLAAPLLVPELELAAASTRRAIEYGFFGADALALAELPVRLVFPYFLGLSAPPLYPLSIGSLGSFTERALSSGPLLLLPALLGLRGGDALLGLRGAAPPRAWFWGVVAVLGWLLSTGPALGLTLLTYRLPLYSLFREPGRHAFESTLALAVLAGVGVARLSRGTVPLREMLGALLGVAGLCGLAWCAAAFGFGSDLEALARSDATTGAALLNPLRNPALGIPLAFALAFGLAAALALGVGRASSAGRNAARFALPALVAANAAAFAWGGYWNWAAAPRSALNAPPLAERLRAGLAGSGQRALWVPGTADGDGIPPNLSLLWGVRATGGYTPLVPRNVQALLDLTEAGTLSGIALASGNALDVSATKFVVVRPADVTEERTSAAPFPDVEAPAFLGGRGSAPIARVHFGNDVPIHANRLSLVSALGFGAEIAQGTQIGEVSVTDSRGGTRTFPLRAGIETAESAAGRPDVAPRLRHRLPRVYARDGAYRTYVADFPLPPALTVARVAVRRTFPDPQNGALIVHAVALVDDRAGTAVALGPLSRFAGEPAHWRRHDEGEFTIFENLAAAPRAWIPREVRRASDAAALEIIRGGDAEDFAARDLAFVNESAEGQTGGSGTVSVAGVADGAMDLAVECPRRCFVMTSDAWYPGWEAHVDGARADVERADVALRGVRVPAGRHAVALRYRPGSLGLGLGLGALAAALLTACAWRRVKVPMGA